MMSDSEQDAIRLDLNFDAPSETVWRALTEPALLERWLMPNDFSPEDRRRFSFRTHPVPGFDGVIRCQVTTVDAPHRLAYTWQSGPVETLVTWTLESAGAKGSRLRLLHDGFGPQHKDIHDLLEGGWRDRSGPLLEQVVAAL